VMAALISLHGDSKGLIFPLVVAPIQVVIVPIYKEATKDRVLEYAANVAQLLKDGGYRVLIDDSNKSPGFKYNQWELKGVPLRIEAGAREIDAQTVTLVRRDTHEKQTVALKDVVAKAAEAGQKISGMLASNSQKELDERITDCKSVDEIKKTLDTKGGFCRVSLCSTEQPGTACGKLIQEKTAGKVRGTLMNKAEKPGAHCVACGKKATAVAYVARQY